MRYILLYGIDIVHKLVESMYKYKVSWILKSPWCPMSTSGIGSKKPMQIELGFDLCIAHSLP